MTDTVISTSGLTKRYGTHTVLDDVNLNVPEGAIYGFVGANGAGKTTTIKILLGLIEATSGEARVLGHKRGHLPASPIEGIAYLPDVPTISKWLTAREAMLAFAQLSGVDKRDARKRADALLDMVGLDGASGKVMSFSRGMRQRLGIALALVGSPRLLVLDEPTSALDPLGRVDVLEIIRSLRGKTTVVFSSHLLADVQNVCTHVGILDRGVLKAQGTIDEVMATTTATATLRVSGSRGQVEQARQLLRAETPDLRVEEEASSLQDAYVRHVKGGRP